MQFLLHSFVGLFLDQIGMFLLNPFPSVPPTTQPVDKTESVAPDFRADRVSRDPDLVGFFFAACLHARNACSCSEHTHQGYEHRHPSLGLPSGGECTGCSWTEEIASNNKNNSWKANDSVRSRKFFRARVWSKLLKLRRAFRCSWDVSYRTSTFKKRLIRWIF